MLDLETMLDALNPFLSFIEKAGGLPYLIGGCVRDHILGVVSKDVDIEVHQMEMDDLYRAVEDYLNKVDPYGKFARINAVGKSYGVIKVWLPGFHDLFPNMEALDLSVPRTERKTGVGSQEFDVTLVPNLGLTEASARRDFTINTMAMSSDGIIHDPYNGMSDLKEGILRATSSQFGEDPLRVLRGLSQSARFDLKATDDTLSMCEMLKEEFHTISKERIWTEWWKWASMGIKPSRGLEFLRDCGWISFFPHIEALMGVPQDKEWHPEGDVFTHTCLVCDEAVRIAEREGMKPKQVDRGVLVMAALCHDLAKPNCTTTDDDGRIRSRGHEKAGEEPTIKLFENMGYVLPKNNLGEILSRVVPLVTNHLAHCSLGTDPQDKAVLRLASRVDIEMLTLLVEADHSGRPPLEKGCPESMTNILKMARLLSVNKGKPEKIITGKILINAGLQGGKKMGDLIEKAYEAQLNGFFNTIEGGLQFLGIQ